MRELDFRKAIGLLPTHPLVNYGQTFGQRGPFEYLKVGEKEYRVEERATAGFPSLQNLESPAFCFVETMRIYRDFYKVDFKLSKKTPQGVKGFTIKAGLLLELACFDGELSIGEQLETAYDLLAEYYRCQYYVPVDPRDARIMFGETL